MSSTRRTLVNAINDDLMKALKDTDNTTVCLPLATSNIADSVRWRVDPGKMRMGSLVFRKDGQPALFRGVGIIEDHRVGPYGHQTDDFFWNVSILTAVHLLTPSYFFLGEKNP